MRPSLRDSVPGTGSVPLSPRLAVSFPSSAAWTPKEETWCDVQPGAAPLEGSGKMGEEKNGTRLECMFLQPPIS